MDARVNSIRGQTEAIERHEAQHEVPLFGRIAQETCSPPLMNYRAIFSKKGNFIAGFCAHPTSRTSETFRPRNENQYAPKRKKAKS